MGQLTGCIYRHSDYKDKTRALLRTENALNEIEDLKEKLSILGEENKLGATKEEVGVLQKYVNYWEPLNFVTRKEIDKIIDEKLGKTQKPL